MSDEKPSNKTNKTENEENRENEPNPETNENQENRRESVPNIQKSNEAETINKDEEENERKKENNENQENRKESVPNNQKSNEAEKSANANKEQDVDPAETASKSEPLKSNGQIPGDVNKATRPHSALYVLHTENGNVSINHRCHLPRSGGVNVEARRKLIIASILCLVFVLCEVVGGVISNSLAVGADAAHTLTDFAGFMISLFAIWVAGRKATDRLSFGWYRAEVIGALISVMAIWFVTAILVWLAIDRCRDLQFEIDALIMIITAIFGILTNVILGFYLSHGASKVEINYEGDDESPSVIGHHHGKRSSNRHRRDSILDKLTAKCCCKKRRRSVQIKKAQNLNVKAAYLHVLGDGLQSVGVLIAGIVIYCQPTWVIADPITTFLFSSIILYTTFNILKDIIVVLMEGTPTFMDYNAVQATFEAIPGVKSIHHLRIWALSLDKIALAVHLVIEHNVNPQEILQKAEEAIHMRYNLFETTIQIEEEGFERPTVVN